MDAANEPPIDEMPIDDTFDGDLLDMELETAFEAMERGNRAWIRTIMPILHFVPKERPENLGYTIGRAYDDVLIAACERAARIFRSDVPPDDA